jgi:hypothetical protein
MDRPPVHELSAVNGHSLRFKYRATLAAELKAEEIQPWLASFPGPLAVPRGQILQVAAKGACDFNTGDQVTHITKDLRKSGSHTRRALLSCSA